MAEIIELQQGIIKNCNYIFQKYMALDVSPEELWDMWWNRTVPAMDKKYINEDKAIRDFMEYRLKITFRDLQVVKGGILWPISK